jgi:hypothetical protein
LRVTAEKYVRLGRDLEATRIGFALYETSDGTLSAENNQAREQELRECLNDLNKVAVN